MKLDIMTLGNRPTLQAICRSTTLLTKCTRLRWGLLHLNICRKFPRLINTSRHQQLQPIILITQAHQAKCTNLLGIMARYTHNTIHLILSMPLRPCTEITLNLYIHHIPHLHTIINMHHLSIKQSNISNVKKYHHLHRMLRGLQQHREVLR